VIERKILHLHVKDWSVMYVRIQCTSSIITTRQSWF